MITFFPVALLMTLLFTATPSQAHQISANTENSPQLALYNTQHLNKTAANTLLSCGMKSQVETMRVLWTVSEYIMLPDSDWTEDQACAMLFKPMDMDDSSITFDNRVCRNITFERQPLKVDDFLRDLKINSTVLAEIRNQQAILISSNCHISGFDNFLRLPDRRLLIYLKGVLFFLEPAVNY